MSLKEILNAGCRAYIATASHLFPAFESKPFGVQLTPFFDGPVETSFHLAYLRSNSIAFDADLGMPHWVYIDYVLLQTAAIGFMIPRERLPKELVAKCKSDSSFNVDELEYFPISGQTAGLAIDGVTWTGVSLFSLSKYFPELKTLGLATHTRALALAAYKAKQFVGITQYDNPAVAIHGKTTKRLFIKQPMVWIHPRKDMTFIYEQEIDYSLETLGERPAEAYSFLLKADDRKMKEHIAAQMLEGKRYQIVAPFRVVHSDGVYLPILEHPSR